MDGDPTTAAEASLDREARGFTFGPFILFPERRRLLERGAPVRVGRRALEVLIALVERQGDLVTKSELMTRVWPEGLVDEGNLKVNIAALRRALGDDFDRPRYIATVVGRGYRFVTPVHHPGPRSADAPASAGNLPTTKKKIFGRADTIRSTAADLRTSRLVSIVGPGGVGKTTVALAVACEMAGELEDGAWFVDLASVSEGSFVSRAVADTLGAPDPGALNSHLRDRQMLVVLDNCEHVIEAVASCAAEILASTRSVTLLTTTRESLCIKGERVRRLSGLSTPPASNGLGAVATLDFAAVQLFVDRAARASKGFAVTDENAIAVGEICRRLEGLALAIECVARRSDTLEVDKMLDYIQHGFHMFDGSPDRAERHRTMTATIDWSYQLLSERERAVLRRLSTFAGAFTLEAACAVTAGDDVDLGIVVDSVANLAAKSLLSTEERDGEMEYIQTNVVRAFAAEKLAAAGETERTQRRHAEYFLRAAEKTRAGLAHEGRGRH